MTLIKYNQIRAWRKHSLKINKRKRGQCMSREHKSVILVTTSARNTYLRDNRGLARLFDNTGKRLVTDHQHSSIYVPVLDHSMSRCCQHEMKVVNDDPFLQRISPQSKFVHPVLKRIHRNNKQDLLDEPGGHILVQRWKFKRGVVQ